MGKENRRADRVGQHATIYYKNHAKILATQNTCGICGQPVDRTIKNPAPWAPVVDHIIPISKGGHPSDIANLQLAHRCCNRAKSNKLFEYKQMFAEQNTVTNNNDLPQHCDWSCYIAN